MRVLMLAPPGAGKGTQGERIAARYRVPHISSGDIFRAEVASDSALGKQLRGYVDAGDLVPDDLVIEMMTDRIIEAAQNEGGYVLDGFPRTLPQAEVTAEIARKAGVTAQVALYLDAPPEVLIARLISRLPHSNLAHSRRRPSSQRSPRRCQAGFCPPPDTLPPGLPGRLRGFPRRRATGARKPRLLGRSRQRRGGCGG